MGYEYFSVGNIITILIIVPVMIIGLFIQYTAIIKQFTERITRTEVKQEALEKEHDAAVKRHNKDVDIIYKTMRDVTAGCKEVEQRVMERLA